MQMTKVEKVMVATAMAIMFVTTVSMAAVVEVEWLESVAGPIWIDGNPINPAADGHTFINTNATEIKVQVMKEQGGVETVYVTPMEGHITRVVMSPYSTPIVVKSQAPNVNIEPVKPSVTEPTVTPSVTPTVTPTPQPTKEPHDNRDGDKKPKKNKP